jgi:6-phosphogluconate dehydrogenase
MNIGMIGLGRMGANMTKRLIRGGHRVIGYDRSADARKEAAASGAIPVERIDDVAAKLTTSRVVWVMVPSGAPTEETLGKLSRVLGEGDLVIDGGNSNYKDTIRRGMMLRERGVGFLDAGTSGGIWGLSEGYCLMVGGEAGDIERARPIFETLAPAADRGWAHVGPTGSGHFVKMIHNGVEYGMMQAMAEGFAILQKKKEFELDLAGIAELWRHGSVVRSWLLDLTARAFAENPSLEGIAPWVSDSGEGRWTVAEAVELDVAAPVITLSLLSRLRSRDADSFSDKLLAAMRNQFGGHAIKAALS